MKSGEFHMKPGRFREIQQISCEIMRHSLPTALHETEEFFLNYLIYKVLRWISWNLPDFMWNPVDFTWKPEIWTFGWSSGIGLSYRKTNEGTNQEMKKDWAKENLMQGWGEKRTNEKYQCNNRITGCSLCSRIRSCLNYSLIYYILHKSS